MVNGPAEKVVQYWHDGKSILDMSELLNRDSDEIILLVMDFARKNVLPARKNGLCANNRIRISEKTMKDERENDSATLFI
ncbi:hypothetical protein BAGQ_3369 [Bacillus sp. CN2]|nr:hypothetical protein BAGQ_3369 [Bacillus velezensis]BCU87746.1 hypothetical protein KOF112_30110 [Bacillus velezensis]GFR54649.1 hypothetical protein BAGQ_3369 [Bacillus sp. CN2]